MKAGHLSCTLVIDRLRYLGLAIVDSPWSAGRFGDRDDRVLSYLCEQRMPLRTGFT